MEKEDPKERTWFASLVPAEAGVSVKAMFGHNAAFLNGHMFLGTFGSDVFVRLGQDDRAKLLAEPGAGPFAPMANRPMKDYVVMPRGWQATPAKARPWVKRSLAWTAALPPKDRKPKAKPKPKPGPKRAKP